ncbi:regulatory protein RecX [Desulfotruncus alcoholivorax]|uniref:regulatory protein RecX n=1 Tax=Desulfotruncus alcoholivorax TaxID=265477 RepID=UPI00040BE5FB|nr:regulatory protein RecX [Desulfotruncus alcoholivorax]
MPDLKKAKNKCYRLLALRPRTEYELGQALKNMNIGQQEISAIINELKDQKLVDDEYFAVNWVRWRLSSKPVGKEFLRAELKYKGIDRKIIEKSLSGYNDDMELEMALLVARKKARQYDCNTWRKLAGFLARRGFSNDVIRKVGCLLAGGSTVDIRAASKSKLT